MDLGRVRFALEELKFLRSYQDVQLFYAHKLPFLLRRLSGNPITDAKIPLTLHLEPTNHCNLNCICCSRDKMKRTKGYMDFSLFEKIIDDASDIGVKRVHLYLHGEPLLHSLIVDMIRHIKSKGLALTMATNGVHLDSAKIEAILESGINSADYVIFSILGHSKEVHQKIMRGVDHERVLHNVFSFLELRQKHKLNGPIIDTAFYRMRENETEQRDFVKYWQSIVDHVRVSGISEHFADNPSSFVREKTCTYLWERMTIYWNGDVTICNADLHGEFVIDTLKEKSIRDIWESEKLLSIKEIHRQKGFSNLSLCCACDR